MFAQAIVWDRSLFGPFRLITKKASLAERNVVDTQLFLTGQPLPDMMGVKHIVFICRPQLALMEAIATVVHAEERKQTAATSGRRGKSLSIAAAETQFHLVFVPRVTRMCTDLLALSGVLGSLSIDGLPCELFPVDSDLLSLELPHMYREVYADADPTALHSCASALGAVQRHFGRIERVYGKGDGAQTLWQLCKSMQGDDDVDSAVDGPAARNAAGGGGAIDQLIILDRSIDLMSVLATQLTYEGLIDELVGINQCVAQFPADAFASNSATTAAGSDADNLATVRTARDTKSIILNSADPLYAQLRDQHVLAVGQTLVRHAKSVALQLDVKDKPVNEIRQMVNDMPRLLLQKESVARHTAIAYQLKQHTESPTFLDELACEQDFLMCENCDKASPVIEDLIARVAPLRTVLRLMCMQCQAANGLRPKVLEHYKRELAQVYGVQVLLTLGNLQRAGLLRVQTGARTYAVLRKTLALTVEEVNELQPNDISYVHTSYAPLSTRIVERSLRKLGWQALHDVLSSLPGPTFQETQPHSTEAADELTGTGTAAALPRRSSLSSEMSLSDRERVIMVFFVGGCTFAEVAALRFLAQRDSNVEFVIATTRLLNKNSFLDEFIEGM